MRHLILFNNENASRWQTYEDTQVMVSNRIGVGDCQIFCKASEVRLGDNVWGHNIVTSIEYIDKKIEKVKFHY